MKIAYFVHDLSDAAVAKRVWMLRKGGAEVRLAGFRRTAEPTPEVAGVPALDLGRTSDARLAQRAGSVLRHLASPGFGRWARGADVLMGRNLETLVLAGAARLAHAPEARLAYECLDVHRLMLGRGAAGRALRAVEGALLSRCSLLIVSSPAFVENYFEPFQRVSRRPGLKTLVVENKAYPDAAPAPPPPPPGPPWRIGWFGMVRCRRSLDFLCRLAARRPDLVRVEIRGRPAYTEFEDFEGQVAATPGVRFGGPYRPDELPGMYGDLHFNWSVDYFQDEGNSRWLLPNRLYEGGRFGAPPIARLDSQTGRWLEAQGLGALFERPDEELEAWLERLTPQAWSALAARHRAAPRSLFVMDPDDWNGLVAELAGRPAAPSARRDPRPAAVAQRA